MRSTKGGGWIYFDKSLKSEFAHIRGRSFSRIEAAFSFALDIDCGNKWTISGYSHLWGWSRSKVRKFTSDLLSEKGHIKDRKKTGSKQAMHLIVGDSQFKKDRSKTGKGQVKDTTINPNPNPNPKKKTTIKNTKKKYGTFENVLLTEKDYQKIIDRFNGSAEEKINNLSEYVESTGKKYKSHYATILAWARREEKKPVRGQPRATTVHQEGIVQRNALAQQILQVRENGNNKRTSVNDNGLIEHKVS